MTHGGRQPSHHLFRVSPHAGVWRLIHNGFFCGDYASEADASAAADAAAGKARASGHTAQIVTPNQGPPAAPALQPDE